MTSKEIKKVIFNNGEISALYYGDFLFWKNDNPTVEYGVNTFAGKFTDDSTESDWYWEPNKTSWLQSNKISIADKVDPITKEFCFDYPVENVSDCLNDKIEKIYHFPSTPNLVSMYEMFNCCTSLTSIDLSLFDTTKCTNFREMFSSCTSLTSIDLSLFDTTKCTDFRDMFSDCFSLTSIDLSNFNTEKATTLNGMFSSCRSLTSIDLSNFNTANVKNMGYMFYGCRSLTSIDLSNFNTASVTYMFAMFYDCGSLTTLNVNFDTSNVTTITNMFGNCSKLTTVTGVFEGTKENLDLQQSPLTNSSAMVFINGLSNVTETKTLSFKSSTYNTLTPEQISIATSKGWTVISI